MTTLDTVRFDLGGRWNGRKGDFKETIKATVETGLDGEENRFSNRFFNNELTGLRIGGSLEAPLWCEVSLPRLLYGSNGRLLRPSDVPAAMDVLTGVLASVIDHVNYDRLTRCDIALHFPVRACESIAALRATRHPAVRSMPREFFETGLEWIGSQIVIRFYDKGVEQNGVTCDVMRLEFQLRGKALAKLAPLFMNGAFDVDEVHRVFYNLVSKFRPRPLAKPATMTEFLALLNSENLSFMDGRRCLEVYLSMKSSARYRDQLRREVQRSRPPQFILDLQDYVPASGEPKFIDVLDVPAVSKVA